MNSVAAEKSKQNRRKAPGADRKSRLNNVFCWFRFQTTLPGVGSRCYRSKGTIAVEKWLKIVNEVMDWALYVA